MSVLTRQDIVKELRRTLGLPERRASECVRTIVKLIATAVASNDQIYLAGLGRLYLGRSSERRYRNRKTGVTKIIRAEVYGFFTPSKVLLRQAERAGE